jgi:hypothetical protein
MFYLFSGRLGEGGEGEGRVFGVVDERGEGGVEGRKEGRG